MDLQGYYEQQGSGAPIVFIHGSYASTSTWKKMVEQLAAEFHCISIKLPGHGGTPDPKDFANPSIATELVLLEQIVHALTDQPIHLVGHSYGGVVALAAALKGELAVRKVTLFEPVAVWLFDILNDLEMSRRVRTFLEKYRHDVACNTPYACAQVIDFWGGEGSFASLPTFIKDGMESLVKNNIRHWDVGSMPHGSLLDLNACGVPTRVVVGDQSNPVAHAICAHLSREMPLCKQTTIEGASHFMVTTHAKECTLTLRS